MPLVIDGITIPFDGDAADLLLEAKKVQKGMDALSETLKDAGISQSAYNKVVAQHKKAADDQATATKEQARALEEEQKRIESAKLSWTDFRSMYQTVLDVIKIGKEIWDEVGQKFVDNAVLVGNFARSLGTTTEEASRLKEVADDVGISVDSLKTSLKLAQKDGFQPNIAGLAAMSDEYLKLQPGVERTQFLLDRFGKSGEEMGKLLEKGGKSIREMSAAMDEGLIVTEEAYQQARQYQVSVDNLKDSWDALTYKAAPPLINAVTNVIDKFRAATKSVEDNGYWNTVLHPSLRKTALAELEAADAAVLATEASGNAGDAFESEAEKTKRLADEQKIAEQAIKDMTKANEDYLKMVADLTKEIESYAEKEDDLKGKHDELIAKKQELIALGYSPEGQSILDINAKLAENEAAQQKNADEAELAGRRRILSMLEQQLAMGGLNQAETDYLLDLGLKWGIYTQEAVDDAKAAQKEVADLTAQFNALPTEKTMTINVVTNQIGGSAGNVAQSTAPVTGKRAAGGPVSAGSAYMVGEKGPELFVPKQNGEIVPNGKMGGITVNFLLDSATPDPERTAYILKPAIMRVLREVGVG